MGVKVECVLTRLLPYTHTHICLVNPVRSLILISKLVSHQICKMHLQLQRDILAGFAKTQNKWQYVKSLGPWPSTQMLNLDSCPRSNPNFNLYLKTLSPNNILYKKQEKWHLKGFSCKNVTAHDLRFSIIWTLMNLWGFGIWCFLHFHCFLQTGTPPFGRPFHDYSWFKHSSSPDAYQGLNAVCLTCTFHWFFK